MEEGKFSCCILWRDIGLGEWLFDHDQDEPAKGLTPAVLAIANDPAAPRAKVAKAREIVLTRQRVMMKSLRDAVLI